MTQGFPNSQKHYWSPHGCDDIDWVICRHKQNLRWFKQAQIYNVNEKNCRSFLHFLVWHGCLRLSLSTMHLNQTAFLILGSGSTPQIWSTKSAEIAPSRIRFSWQAFPRGRWCRWHFQSMHESLTWTMRWLKAITFGSIWSVTITSIAPAGRACRAVSRKCQWMQVWHIQAIDGWIMNISMRQINLRQTTMHFKHPKTAKVTVITLELTWNTRFSACPSSKWTSSWLLTSVTPEACCWYAFCKNQRGTDFTSLTSIYRLWPSEWRMTS